MAGTKYRLGSNEAWFIHTSFRFDVKLLS